MSYLYGPGQDLNPMNEYLKPPKLFCTQFPGTTHLMTLRDACVFHMGHENDPNANTYAVSTYVKHINVLAKLIPFSNRTRRQNLHKTRDDATKTNKISSAICRSNLPKQIQLLGQATPTNRSWPFIKRT